MGLHLIGNMQSHALPLLRTRSSTALGRERHRTFTSTPKRLKERLVILGSGWGGYNVLRKVSRRRYDVTLISNLNYFAMTPLLAGTCVGTLEFRCAIEPVRKYAPQATYLQAWADHIDFARKSIRCVPSTPPISSPIGPETDLQAEISQTLSRNNNHPAFDIKYDRLVIAVGAYSQTFDIEGVAEHAMFLKNAGEARAIRNRLLECFEQAAQPTLTDSDRRKLLSFVVVGGGPTGIEFAAELHDLCASDIAKHYSSLANLVSITVYETSDRILASFDVKLQEYAMDRFKREGITIKSKHRVKRVLPSAIEVEGEGIVPCGLCVWSTGLAPNPLVRDITEIKKDPKTKSLITNDRLECLDNDGKPMPEVLAIGDAAVIDNNTLPATAQVASQKALYTAKKLNAAVRARSFDEPFVFNSKGSLAYIGGWTAIYDRSNVSSGPQSKETGRLAWILWRSAYLSTSLSWRNRILVAVFWFTNWLFGRDIGCELNHSII